MHLRDLYECTEESHPSGWLSFSAKNYGLLLTSTICCVIIITEPAYFVVIIAERMIFDEYSRSAKAHFA